MKTLTNLFLCLCLVAGTCVAQAKPKRACSPRNKAFETELKQAMDELNVVGLSIAVVKKNMIIYNNSYGYKDLVTKAPVTNDTYFRIASISKSFSAVSIMQLVEQGKLTLDTDVNDVLNFKVRNPKYPDTPITVEMLLDHTSSLNDSEGYWESLDCITPGKNDNYTKAYNDYMPGTKYEYCNLNFSLLGSIIERVSGERFDLYVLNHILKPLGLNASFNINDIPAKKIGKLYSWDGSKFEEQNAYRPIGPDVMNGYKLTESSVTFSPAGGMKISARNLAKYMLMHMNYGKSPLAKTRILKEESSKLMQVDHTPGFHYGLALEQTDEYTPGDVLVGHTGGAYGLRSAMFFNPSEKYGIVMICSGCNNPTIVLNKIMPIIHKHFIKK
ncbi:MAG: beta-lactamase family protein [Bacteroidales bacterium]|nr:beta-lactamase family protein [Candidatus Sodaliphilus limicaballi]